MSDHDRPLIESDANTVKRRQTPRKVTLYKTTDWYTFENDLRKTNNQKEQKPDSTPVERL